MNTLLTLPDTLTALKSRLLCDSTIVLLETLEKDKKRLDGIRKLCGYIEAGECSSITIGQDDATKDWILYCGDEWWAAPTFRGAIDKSITAALAKQEGES